MFKKIKKNSTRIEFADEDSTEVHHENGNNNDQASTSVNEKASTQVKFPKSHLRVAFDDDI
jgi:hypothetical protein